MNTPRKTLAALGFCFLSPLALYSQVVSGSPLGMGEPVGPAPSLATEADPIDSLPEASGSEAVELEPEIREEDKLSWLESFQGWTDAAWDQLWQAGVELAPEGSVAQGAAVYGREIRSAETEWDRVDAILAALQALGPAGSTEGVGPLRDLAGEIAQRPVGQMHVIRVDEIQARFPKLAERFPNRGAALYVKLGARPGEDGTLEADGSVTLGVSGATPQVTTFAEGLSRLGGEAPSSDLTGLTRSIDRNFAGTRSTLWVQTHPSSDQGPRGLKSAMLVAGNATSGDYAKFGSMREGRVSVVADSARVEAVVQDALLQRGAFQTRSQAVQKGPLTIRTHSNLGSVRLDEASQSIRMAGTVKAGTTVLGKYKGARVDLSLGARVDQLGEGILPVEGSTRHRSQVEGLLGRRMVAKEMQTIPARVQTELNKVEGQALAVPGVTGADLRTCGNACRGRIQGQITFDQEALLEHAGFPEGATLDQIRMFPQGEGARGWVRVDTRVEGGQLFGSLLERAQAD